MIDPRVIIEEFSQIGAGSTVGKGAKIDKNVFIGIGSTVVGSLTIGKGSTVGAGSVVIENIPAGKRVFGNPAKIL